MPHRHASYEALADDPDVDAVYVSPPHPFHQDATLLALRGRQGGAVREAVRDGRRRGAEMVAAARASGTLLVEAMWTRFLPTMVRVREILAAGTLGEIVYLTAEHGQWFAEDPAHRLFAPSLGGGALLDLGVYPMSFAHMVLGTPARITAVSEPAFTGVDRTTSVILQYDGGAHAVLTTSLAAASNNPAVIYGTEARLELDGWFYTPTSFRVVVARRRGARELSAARRRPRHGVRGDRGGPLPGRGADREPAHAAGRDAGRHGDHGRDPPPDRPGLQPL